MLNPPASGIWYLASGIRQGPKHVAPAQSSENHLSSLRMLNFVGRRVS